MLYVAIPLAWAVAELIAPTPFHDDARDRPAMAQGKLQAQGDAPPSDWDRYRARLGTCPVYRVEALTRDRQTGRVGYFRVLISRRMPRPVVMGFALDDDGKCVRIPDPGYGQGGSDLREKGPRQLPLAFLNGSVGVRFEPRLADDELRVVRESCCGYGVKLPQREGQAEWAFHLGLFRVERLSAEQVRAAEPLTLDPWEHMVRVGAIQIELIARHRAKPLSVERELPAAAELFGAAAFVDPVRAALAAWVERTPAEVAGRGFPRHLTWALACSGTVGDIDLLARLAARHPNYAGWVRSEALELERRFGRAWVAPLAGALVADWAGRAALGWLSRGWGRA